MKIKRETIVAGSIISRRIYGGIKKTPGEKRSRRSRPTLESVAVINRKNSERELMIKLHHNFGPGDLHVVLTYKGQEPTKEQAKKEVNNFLKRLRRYFKKKGTTLKWIMVTEYENQRIHHHMILSQMDTYDLDQLWTAGKARPTHLDTTGDYRKLASYLIKETDKTFRSLDAYSKQRFSCSRTVETPPKKVEEVDASQLIRDPKPIRGYYIDQESIYRGVNPVTNVPYLEYIMISESPKPRLSIWPKGKKRKYKERYYNFNELNEYQIRFVMPWEVI